VLKAKKEDSALGDVAREIMNDPAINRRWSYRGLYKYLDNRNGVSPALMNVLSNANDAFVVQKAVKRLQGLV
jgi:hypothetical protein